MDDDAARHISREGLAALEAEQQRWDVLAARFHRSAVRS
jgi:hypothetical protein